MGGVRNRVKIVTRDGIDQWPDMAKEDVATKLAEMIAERLRRG
jgi:phosphopantothenoylcysteine decarboxylase/phosphopantothenate--cysteine ligase